MFAHVRQCIYMSWRSSNRQANMSNTFRRHEAAKKRAYDQRIREVEHATLTPLVFSATGGLGSQANTFYKRLASLLSEKWDFSYSSTLCWLRCRLAFSLLRSAIQSIRGARSSRGHAVRTPPVIDLVNLESNLSMDHWTLFSFPDNLCHSQRISYTIFFSNTLSTCSDGLHFVMHASI